LGAGIGCSIGWATSGADRDLLELIEEADAAMYLAKTARRHERRVAAAQT
jgi:GGDEF domain-containing protein